jgi:hypothetical protein
MYVTSNFHVLKYQIRKHDPRVYNPARRVIKIIILENEHSYVIKYPFWRFEASSGLGEHGRKGRDYRFTIRH